MIKKILFLFFVVFAATAYSQDVTITGTVTDANSEPLVGVNVLVKGTTTGAITDIDGNYTLNVNQGATIISLTSLRNPRETSRCRCDEHCLERRQRDAGRSGGSRLRCAEEKLRDRSHFAGEGRRHAKPYYQ